MNKSGEKMIALKETATPDKRQKIVDSVEKCPQSYSVWRDAVDILTKKELEAILMSIIDSGRMSVSVGCVEGLILNELSKSGE